jgi:hypothetical protein
MRVACIYFHNPSPTSKIAELFLRFSPQIALRKERAIFVEIGRCRNLYSEESFLVRAQILLNRAGLSASIKIADSIPHAAALAVSNTTDVEALPLAALLEIADPFDRDSDLRKNISNLISTFQDLGIKTLAQFRKLPLSELLSRFGVVGRFCYIRIRNEEFIEWPYWKPEEIISEKKDFPHFEFYGELEPILFELKSQLDQIFPRLRARGLRTIKIQVEIKCEKTSRNPNFLRTLVFDFHAPQGSTKGTLRVLKERLTREFEKRPIVSPIEFIETRILKTVPNVSGQKNVFNNDEERFEELSSIQNQLAEIVGKENVFHAELTEDRRPEKSWTRSFRLPHAPPEQIVDLTDKIGDRPTYLLKRPTKIEVTAGFVHINKRKYRITNWERQREWIKGGWFLKPAEEIKDTFDRVYDFVDLEGGFRIFVFETPEREFFLHGYFG